MRDRTPKRSLPQRWKNIAVLLLIPWAYTLLFGFMYSPNYVEHIPLAVLDLDGSPVSLSVLRQVEDSRGLEISCYVSSEKEMEASLQAGSVQAGLVIPNGFGEKLRRFQSPQVLVFTDHSNLVVGNNAMAYLSTVFHNLNAGLSMGKMEAGEIVPYTAEQTVTTLGFTERMLYEPYSSYFCYMFAVLLSIFIQQTYLSVITPVFVEEKLRLMQLPGGETEQRRKQIGIRSLNRKIWGYGALTFVGSFGALALASSCFGFPLRGSVGLMLLLQLIFVINLTAMAFLMAVFFNNKAHCAQFILFISTPTVVTAGYLWPEFIMPAGFAWLVKKIWPMIYFVNPFQELQVKGVGLSLIAPYLGGGLLFALIWLPLSILLYTGRIKKGSGRGRTEAAGHRK